MCVCVCVWLRVCVGDLSGGLGTEMLHETMNIALNIYYVYLYQTGSIH